MNDIIKIIKSLEDLVVLIDGVTETVKHEIKKKRRLISLPASFVQLVISSVVKVISGRRVRRTERRCMDEFFSSTPSFKQFRYY